jgi:phospholipid/cholesterol/gamma-HCH transport system substrate-binding protein
MIMATYARNHDARKVGVIAVLALLSFLALFFFATGRGIAMDRSVLHVQLERADNLKKGDPVLFRGVHVGDVSKLSFSDGGGVVLTLQLKRQIPLTEGASAVLVGRGVFGEQSVDLRDGLPDGGRLSNGAMILGATDAGMAGHIERLSSHAERLIGDSTAVLAHGSLAAMMKTSAALEHLIADANRVLMDQSAGLQQVTRNTVEASENLSRLTADGSLSNTAAQLEQAAASLARAAANSELASHSLVVVLRKLENGEGTAGLLLNDASLFDSMVRLSEEIEEIVIDLKTNPKRYMPSVRVF